LHHGLKYIVTLDCFLTC